MVHLVCPGKHALSLYDFLFCSSKVLSISSKYIKSGLLPNLKFLFSGFPNRPRLTRTGGLHSKYKLWRIELLYRYKRAKTSRVTVLNSENCFFNLFTLNRMFTLSGSHHAVSLKTDALHTRKNACCQIEFLIQQVCLLPKLLISRIVFYRPCSLKMYISSPNC